MNYTYLAEGAAAFLPFVPGGAGAALKAVRGVDKVSDAVGLAKGVDKTTDAVKAADKSNDVRNVVSDTKTAQKSYQTYTKYNDLTGQTYVGRTSGTGTPEQNVRKRDSNHHMNKEGYGPAKLDKTSLNPYAIRGQEQYMMTIKGGAKVDGGTSGNKINGVSSKNPKKEFYEQERIKEFK